MHDPHSVIIVGAGPVGLVLSLLLARLGHRVTVVERHAAPYPLPRAIGISHESLRILHAAGASVALSDALDPGKVGLTAKYMTHSGELLLELPIRPLAESGWPEMQSFNQPDAEAILDSLVAANARIRLLRGHVVTAVGQDAEGAQIEVAPADATTGGPAGGGNRETLRGDYVIGCDGANSVVRHAMSVPVTDLGFTWDWLVVDIEPTVEREWEPCLGQVLGPPRTVTWAPAGRGRRRFEFMLLPGETREDMSAPEIAWQLLAERGVDPTNAKLVRHVVYSFKALWAERWRSGRLLLAGDSAHLTPPFLAQGLNSGMRDAATLAWRLDLAMRGLVPTDTLDDYGTERIAHVRDLIAQAVDIGRLLCVVDVQACEERNGMLRYLQENPAAAPPPPLSWRIGAGALAQGDEHAGQLGWQGRIRKHGQEGMFDDLFGAGRFALLGRSGDPRDQLTPAARTVWDRLGGVSVHLGTGSAVTDVDGTYAQWFTKTGSDVILTRPDYYIFGTGKSLADAEGLVLQLANKLQLIF